MRLQRRCRVITFRGIAFQVSNDKEEEFTNRAPHQPWKPFFFFFAISINIEARKCKKCRFGHKIWFYDEVSAQNISIRQDAFNRLTRSDDHRITGDELN